MDRQMVIDTISSITSVVFFIGIITMVVVIVKKHRKGKDSTEV